MNKSPWQHRSFVGICIFHVLMLSWELNRDGFTSEEVAHLPSGLFHWERGEFSLFNVNPPLVRMIATLPVIAFGYTADWSSYVDNIYDRPERALSVEILKQNGIRSYRLLTLSRISCIPFDLLGLWICWRWAGELFGSRAAIFAAVFWCFSPNIIGNGHLITPDVPAASIGIAAFYLFRNWLRIPTWRQAVICGLVFGQAQATKTSWIILFVMWPALWILWRLLSKEYSSGATHFREAKQLGLMLILGIWSLNVWYGFAGTLTPLGEFNFLSRTLAGPQSFAQTGVAGNRFKGSWLGYVPVPFPKDYIQGIDRQRLHFEQPDRSYLNGRWRKKGWWYYYVYAVLVKEPVGFLILGGISVSLMVAQRFRASIKDEMLLVIPFVLLVVFISSQVGFNRHLRYILPSYPFAIVLFARVGRVFTQAGLILPIAVSACAVWAIVSSICACPHSLGYFNEFAGGPLNGRFHLNSSNTDCGQDLLYLKRWIDSHPEAHPLHLAWDAPHVQPSLAEVELPTATHLPSAGWHAVSVNRLPPQRNEFTFLSKFSPVAWAGYSIAIYHLTFDDCVKLESKDSKSDAAQIQKIPENLKRRQSDESR